MLHQVLRAIEPPQSLQSALDHWDEIRLDLRERTRARRLQLNGLSLLT